MEELSLFLFINVLRRFILFRGLVKIICLDCGINFVGVVDELKIDSIYVGDDLVKLFFNDNRIWWIFNVLYLFYMGGVWERMIGVIRRILDFMMLYYSGYFIYDIFVIFMVEVCVIINFRLFFVLLIDFEDFFFLSFFLIFI